MTISKKVDSVVLDDKALYMLFKHYYWNRVGTRVDIYQENYKIKKYKLTIPEIHHFFTVYYDERDNHQIWVTFEQIEPYTSIIKDREGFRTDMSIDYIVKGIHQFIERNLEENEK